MLRAYQREICDEVFRAWERCRSVMVQMPTGTGKTYVLAEIVRRSLRSAETALVVAHRRELVSQARAILGLTLPAETRCRVNVCSIQWLARHPGALSPAPSLVIIDEAHHARALTYRRLWDTFPRALFLGLTATPWRMGGGSFTGLFDALVQSRTVAEFVLEGVLSRYDYFGVVRGGEDCRLVGSLVMRGPDGDYQTAEMERTLDTRPAVCRLLRSVTEHAAGRKGIVYAISVSHAERIAQHYRQCGISAVSVSAATPRAERERAVRCLREGSVRVLVNVDIFSEGFDCPDVEFIQLARPTLSLAKYLQMVGRGLRRSPGKDHCTILDNVGLYLRFGLPTTPHDWQGHFEGRIKALPSWSPPSEPTSPAVTPCAACHEPPASAPIPGPGLELVVGHAGLAQWIERERETAERMRVERIRQLRETLREERRMEAAQSVGASVRGMVRRVVNGLGETVYDGPAECHITGDCFVWYKTVKGHKVFIDGKSLVRHETGYYGDARPRVSRRGWLEITSFNSRCYTRSRHPVMTADSGSIRTSGVCVLVNGVRALPGGAWEEQGHDYCYIEGDDTLYKVEAEYIGPEYLLSDMAGGYWRVTAPDGRRTRLRVTGEAELKEEKRRMAASSAERERMAFAALERSAAGMEPYEHVRRWGLRHGDDIIIKAQFLHVEKPVGIYFAFEQYAMRWGVMDIHGNVVVKPKYRKVEIRSDGTALLTLSRDLHEEVTLGVSASP